MRVDIHSKEIRVNVEENSLDHRIINNFCNKSFSNILALKTTLIIYHKEEESGKKRYFYNWLYSAYKKRVKKLDRTFLKRLQDNLTLPIKIKVYNKRDIVHGIKVKIMFLDKNTMRLSIDALNEVPITYFKHIFRNAIKEEFLNNIDVKTTISSVRELKKILGREKILGLPVLFIFNEKTVNNLISKLDDKSSERRYSNNYRFKHENRRRTNHRSARSEVLALEKSYALLKCEKDADKGSIKRQYLKLVKEFHPDRVYGQSEDIIAHYTKKFQEISDAYTVIQKSLSKVA